MSSQRQTIHSIHNKKFWTEFFYLYESLPELWDINNPLYKNRQVKCDAYDIMVDKLREIEPNADREDVLRKINIFRTNFRRECSRINMSLKEGRYYQSTLWYFDLLCFLQTADTKRDRRRKLNDNGEKSIMRKRRSDMVQKSSDQLIVATKRESLIEYHPHSTNEFEYELEEEPDFDYVPVELANALGESKHESNSETQQNHSARNNYQSVEEDDDDEENQSHQVYSHQGEFQSYTVQRNIQARNKKLKLSVDNVAQLNYEMNRSETPTDVNNVSEEQQEYHEYNSDTGEEILKSAQWCIKTTNAQNMSTSQLEKAGIHVSNISTASTVNVNDNIPAKYVRDVKTMTSNSLHGNCCGKLSESSEILAKSWAVQYDELSHEQKLLARKAINDILFEGCMGNLAVGLNGRVDFKNGADYKNHDASKISSNEEVESSEIYEQCIVTASSASSTSGIGSNATINMNAKVHTTDEWIKL